MDVSDHLATVLDGEDSAARIGVAGMCAHRLTRTANIDVAATTLAALVNDADNEVRKKAAELAAALRSNVLRPFEDTLKVLVSSPAFGDALPQLLITLEQRRTGSTTWLSYAPNDSSRSSARRQGTSGREPQQMLARSAS